MSELKDYDIMDIEAFDDERIKASSNGMSVPATRVYIKAEVDSAIDELKREHHRERHEYIDMVAQLKAKLVEQESENRKLKRALYKACANWARSERYTEATWHGDEHREELWAKVEVKCLKKAEECK